MHFFLWITCALISSSESFFNDSITEQPTESILASAVSSEATPLADLLCKYTPGLNEAQQNICREYPAAMPILQQEVTKLIQNECTSQLKGERWNCSSVIPPIVGEQAAELQGATREAAFTHALTSASMVYAITKACSEGRINNCGCDSSMNGKEIQSGWQWGGCSDDVEFGYTFASNFLDARESESGSTKNEVGQSLANLHNNAVGRMIVKNGMKLKCRCHGVSGSCATRTCWRELPDIETIGQQIKQKYDDSIQVSVKETKAKLTLKEVNSEPADDASGVPTNHLVHLKQSSDYCAFNANYTKGRLCVPREMQQNEQNNYNVGINGTIIIVDTELGACEDLCCNGNFEKESHEITETCGCRFEWCCEVQCTTCTTITNTYKCIS